MGFNSGFKGLEYKHHLKFNFRILFIPSLLPFFAPKSLCDIHMPIFSYQFLPQMALHYFKIHRKSNKRTTVDTRKRFVFDF